MPGATRHRDKVPWRHCPTVVPPRWRSSAIHVLTEHPSTPHRARLHQRSSWASKARGPHAPQNVLPNGVVIPVERRSAARGSARDRGMAVNVSQLNAGRFSGTSLEAPLIQVYHFSFDRRAEGLLAFRCCYDNVAIGVERCSRNYNPSCT